MPNPNLVRKPVDPTQSTSVGEVVVGQLIPPGTIFDSAATAAPSGWLFCDGSAVSRSTYSALFAVIGTTYGVGNGSTTFNLPDTRGRTRAGKDNMGGTAANRLTSAGSGVNGQNLGATGGAETHTLSTAHLPSHNHGGGGHGHRQLVSGGAGGNTGYGHVGSQTVGYSVSGIGTWNTESSGTIIGSEGSGSTHQNTQPTIIFNTIIKY